MTSSGDWRGQQKAELIRAIRAELTRIAEPVTKFVPGTELADAIARHGITGMDGASQASLMKHISDLLCVPTTQRRLPNGRRARGYPLAVLSEALDRLEQPRA